MPASAPLHAQTSRTRIGVQTTDIATIASTLKDIEILGGGGGPLDKLVQGTAPNNAQVRRRREYKQQVKLTKKGAPVEFRVLVKGVATPLTTSATPVAYTHADALSHQILMWMLFGAELTPAAGSLVVSSSGTPVDTVTVTGTHGTRFTIGSMVFIVGSGVRRVTAIATDALTVFPPLASAPSVGAVVRNLYQYYPGESDDGTATVEHTPVESGTAVAQKRAYGVHGSGEFKLDLDAAAELGFKGTCVDWTGPSDLSISDDPVADDMGDPMVWSPTIYYGMSSGAAPTIAAEVATVKVTMPRKWQDIPGSVVNGVGSVREVAGRGEPIEIVVDGLFDEAWYSRFSADTANEMLAYTLVGSGSTSRVFGFYAGNTKVVEAPTEAPNGELIFSSAKLRAFQDDTISGAAPALSVAGIRTANIIFFMG